MANRSGPPGGLGRGNPSGKGNKGGRGKPGGLRSKPGGNPRSAGHSLAGAGGEKTQKKGSVMRESTWNNMTKGERMKEYGTTSYAKYKAGKKATNIRGTSRTNIQMRGRND